MSSVLKVDKIQSDTGSINLASSLSGSLSFSGTGNRITGDFSNATVANRVAFQTSTTDGATDIPVIPNGTGTNARHFYYSASDTTNASLLTAGVVGAEATFRASAVGSGTSPTMTFYTGGSERMRIGTSGNVGIGTSTPVGRLRVSGSDAATIALVNGGTRGVRIGADTVGGFIEGVDNTGTGSYQPLFVGGSDVRFTTSNIERMRIDAGGYLNHTQPSTGSVFIRGGFYLAMAIGSSIDIVSSIAGALLIVVYDIGSGNSGVFFGGYSTTITKLAGNGEATDSGSTFAVYKTLNTHTITVKNRYGIFRNIGIAVFSAYGF